MSVGANPRHIYFQFILFVGVLHKVRKEHLMWRPHSSICDLLSAATPFVRVSGNSLYKFVIKSCQTRASLVKIGSVTVTWGCKWIAVHIPHISWLILFKFNVGYVRVMPLTVMSSVEVDGVKAILYLKAIGILSLFFTYFVLFVYNKVWEMFTKVYWVIMSFIKIGMVKAIF